VDLKLYEHFNMAVDSATEEEATENLVGTQDLTVIVTDRSTGLFVDKQNIKGMCDA
jgi:hypothetical protein